MIGMSDKEQSREKRDAIRRILMSGWDPIGVNDTPEAADEYDGYIGPVLDLLNSRASSHEVAGHLRKGEIERMGLTDAQGKPLLPTQRREAAIQSLKLLMPDKVASRKSFRHWKLFAKTISPAFAKIQQRREEGVCTGCGLSPCKCKNPRNIR
jgi:hypothetical protein